MVLGWKYLRKSERKETITASRGKRGKALNWTRWGGGGGGDAETGVHRENKCAWGPQIGERVRRQKLNMHK